MTDEKTKVCTKCGRELPLSEFSKHKITKDGLKNWCKSCTREYDKIRYETHKPDKLTSDELAHKHKYWSKYYNCVAKPSCLRVGRYGAQFETFICETCGKEFRRLKSSVDSNYKHRGYLPRFCSKECYFESRRKSHTSEYAKEIERIKKEI